MRNEIGVWNWWASCQGACRLRLAVSALYTRLQILKRLGKVILSRTGLCFYWTKDCDFLARPSLRFRLRPS